MEKIIFVDKPAGMSSFGAVARVRRILSEQEGHKVKVGHTGTLDPFATGLLILLAGKATKKAPELTKLDKVYEAVIRLGATSSTGDPEGEITITDEKPVFSLTRIEAVLARFVGKIKQIITYTGLRNDHTHQSKHRDGRSRIVIHLGKW